MNILVNDVTNPQKARRSLTLKDHPSIFNSERERERERDLLGNNVHDGGVQGAAR